MPYLTPEFAMRKLLRDNAGVQAAINSAQTVCPVEDVPRDVDMPFATYRRLNASTQHYMGGVATSGLWMGTTEMVYYAETFEAAYSLANAARAVLDGAELATVTVGSDSCTIERMHLTNEDTEVFEPADASDSRVHVVRQEYDWSIRP